MSGHPYTTLFPAALGTPTVRGTLKAVPEDFIVEEQLSFALSGTGHHLYLQVQKTGANTEWVARQLAAHFKVPARDVGYAGLKDRQAITTQWFSVPVRQYDPQQVAQLMIEGVTCLQAVPHERKLRKGAIAHNGFTITLRELAGDLDDLRRRLDDIRVHGVPNYFDAQRFGHDRQNLVVAQALFEKKRRLPPPKRGLYLSAARAWLFNHILARRIAEQSWHRPLPGDVFWLNGTKRFFLAEAIDSEIERRVTEGDIHPTGALWGEGQLASTGEVAALESAVAAQWPILRDGLEAFGLEQDRRAQRVIPAALEYQIDAAKKNLQITFRLPAGSYATTLLGELVREPLI